MSYGICKEFPALSPFDIETKTFHEVIRLFSRLRTLQIANEKDAPVSYNRPGKIRRPAGDDWF